MLKWNGVLDLAKNGNLRPKRRVEKTEQEWKALLSDESFNVTRKHGTERPHSSEMCSLLEPGLYACVCCDTLLFDASQKFESGTGWPSFTQPIEDNVINYIDDSSFGMTRIETTCSTCDAHLGHVFPDGPAPSGLRYCMNAVALKKVTKTIETATFGGGCFWCTEAIFQRLVGVESVLSGYSGGKVSDPSYREVCGGRSGHAEVVQVTFDSSKISYEDLLRIHLTMHNPTTLNQQGADIGTQYRSIILAHNDEQSKAAEAVIKEVQGSYSDPIVTEIAPFTAFYEAEQEHHNYFNDNHNNRYCQVVIDPKLEKFKSLYADKLV